MKRIRHKRSDKPADSPRVQDRRDRNIAEADRKADKQDKTQGQRTPHDSHKGKIVSLEGQELLRTLADHRIFELKKRNPSFPNARFYCRLCEYHLDRPQDCERHVDENRHQHKKDALDMEGILEQIPKPTVQHINAMDMVVQSIVQTEGLSAAELKSRQDVVSRLQNFIHQFKKEATLRLYGSSLSGVGLKGSDINVEVSGSEAAPVLLTNVYNILTANGAPKFVQVQRDFTAKIPVVFVTDAETQSRIVLTINGQPAVLTSSLLQLYSLADPRVQALTVTMRIWAKICHLDRQEEGTLPPFAFNILVVYFLQQVQPPVLDVLPVEKTATDGRSTTAGKVEDKTDFDSLRSQAEAWQSKNESSVGELWLQLLKFYCLEFDNKQFVVSLMQREPLTRQEKKWSSKKLAIEDPFSPRKNIANSLTNTLIFEYYESCLRKTYEYFGMPRDKDGNVTICMETLKALASKKTESLLNENQEPSPPSTDSASTKQSEDGSPTKERSLAGETGGQDEEGNDESSLGSSPDSPVVIPSNKSIVRALKAVSIQKDLSQIAYGESVAASDRSEVSDVNETTDSGILASNCEESAHSEQSVLASEAVSDSALTVPSTSGLDNTADSVSGLSTSDCCNAVSEVSAYSENGAFVECAQDSSAISWDLPNVSDLNAADTVCSDNESKTSSELSFKDAAESMVSDFSQLEVKEEKQQKVASTTISHNGAETEEQLAEDQGQAFSYLFAESVFTGGKGPAVICGYCEKEGHTKANCPDDKLPTVKALAPIPKGHMVQVDRVINQIIYDFAPSDRAVWQRNQVVKDLENFIRPLYPDACFSLFGSSCNGFGFFSSDLDICLTFRGKTVEDIDVTDIIEKLSKKLKQKGSIHNVIPIPTAKVPIIKFTDIETQLEGDISLYNTLAQHNTDLLNCYSRIDQRVRVMGYAVKVFAKVCDIGDASRGSLSSYGYVLMMLHYLQQCQPPVIPVLQELHPENKKPECMVEGCNTWFFSDLPKLPNVWRFYQKNKMSAGELWIDFLRFYLEKFDWKTMVISIRQIKPLYKFDKMWNGHNIAIEDPFDWNHNLGVGLSRKMNNYIYKTFVNARMRFGVPFQNTFEVRRRYANPSEYFFDADKLTDGAPPNDRGCRMCGKIGHLVRDCPNRGRRRKPGQNERDSKDKEGQPERFSNKKEARGPANTPAKGQHQKQGKGQPNAPASGQAQTGEGPQSKIQAKGKPESKSPGKSKAKGQEKFKGEDCAQKRNENNRSQGYKPDNGNEHTKQDHPSHGQNTGSSQMRHQHQFSSKDSQFCVPGNSGPITTTASAKAAVTTTSWGKVPLVPPGFSSTPQRPPVTPSQVDVVGSLPSPVASNPDVASRPEVGQHPPGLQMDLQQLFSMAKQSQDRPLSMRSYLPNMTVNSQSGMSPKKVMLTPEQQVAMMGMYNVNRSSSQRHQSPECAAAGKTGSEVGKTPLSLSALFQQCSTSQTMPLQYSSSPQQGGMPFMTMNLPHSQAPPVVNFSHQNASSPSKMPPPAQSPNKLASADSMPHMTPLSLSALFASHPSVHQSAWGTGRREQDQNRPSSMMSVNQVQDAEHQSQQLHQHNIQMRTQLSTQQVQHERNRIPTTTHTPLLSQGASLSQQSVSSPNQFPSSYSQQLAQHQRQLSAQHHRSQLIDTHHPHNRSIETQQPHSRPIETQHLHGQPIDAWQHHGQQVNVKQPYSISNAQSQLERSQSQSQPASMQALDSQTTVMHPFQGSFMDREHVQVQQQFLQNLMQTLHQQNQPSTIPSSTGSHSAMPSASLPYPAATSPGPCQLTGSSKSTSSIHSQLIAQQQQQQKAGGDPQRYQNQSLGHRHPQGLPQPGPQQGPQLPFMPHTQQTSMSLPFPPMQHEGSQSLPLTPQQQQALAFLHQQQQQLLVPPPSSATDPSVGHPSLPAFLQLNPGSQHMTKDGRRSSSSPDTTG